MKAAEIHKRLENAYAALWPIFGQLEGDMRADTAFAIGELTGFIAKVKALVGRDIDDRRESGLDDLPQDDELVQWMGKQRREP